VKFYKGHKCSEIAPGGMKALELEGNEIVICNSGGNTMLYNDVAGT